MRLSSRLAFITVVFLLPALGASGFAFYREYRRVSAHADESARQVSETIGAVLTEALNEPSDPLAVVASEAAALTNSVACQASLQKFLDVSHGHYLDLAVLDDHGQFFCSVSGGDRFRIGDLYRENGVGLLLVHSAESADASATVFVKTSLIAEAKGAKARYLVSIFTLDWLAKRTWQIDLPAKTSYVIRDDKSKLLAKYSVENTSGSGAFDASGVNSEARSWRSQWVYGEAPVLGPNGKNILQVAVALDRQETVGDDVVRSTVIAFATTIAVVMYLFAIWIWLHKLIRTPIRAMQISLRGVEAGNLDTRLFRKEQTLEMSGLARTVDRLIETLIEKSLALMDLQTEEKEQSENDVRSTRRAVQGRLAGRVSEELSEPLGVLGGSVLALEAAVESDDGLKIKMNGLFDQISSSVDRVTKLTTTLNSFADDSSGEEFQVAPLLPLAKDTLEFARRKMRRASAFLSFNGFDETTKAYCQPRQVQKILLTLVDNALEAVESVAIRSIFVEAEIKKEWIEISVKDTGPGISRADAARIFDPFFTSKTAGGGLGLGLTVARAMAVENNGDLYLDLTSNKTRFVLKLPRRQHVTRSNLMAGA